MSEKLTPEQLAAIKARGKVIVSASAGSGKTFVMIQKLCNLIEGGCDLDNILAVTFTKKAAAQMKEKLRSSLVRRLASADDAKRAAIKEQLNKIPSAAISTIHSFCAQLVRTYFYVLEVDGAFDIVSDDAQANKLKYRALDNLFDALYERDDGQLRLVLSCLARRRSDDNVKALILEAYEAVRNVADYADKLRAFAELYTERGFERVCSDYALALSQRCAELRRSVEDFERDFSVCSGGEKYAAIFKEMKASLEEAAGCDDLFAPLPPLSKTRRPNATDEVREAAEAFADFRTRLKKKYDCLKADIGSREEEYAAYMQGGALAVAFADLVLQFDAEYSAIKRDESKLDYGDLEHLTLRLLKDGNVKRQLHDKYKYVFVDEYQDVNPVQERIISEVGGSDVFTVGDVKQAIYGFRGSKSVFFSQKYERMKKSNGALRLSNNFRSSDGVLDFVNALFSDIMTEDVSGFDYKGGSEMVHGGKYPQGYGSAELHVFGKEDGEKGNAEGVYSVAGSACKRVGHTREGLAVLEIVKRELSSRHYDLKEGREVDTQPGDICILARKNGDDSVAGIVAALTDAGYSVTAAKGVNVCTRAEVRELIDILSLIDNCQQDIPLSTALLSPLGKLTRDELARIRISCLSDRSRPTFRECMVTYARSNDDGLSRKIKTFFKKINDYRRLSEVLGAARLIERIMADTGLSARYAAGGGERLASIRRLTAEAYSPSGELSLSAFLQKLKNGGYKVSAPPSSTSDSIKVMTMHASKGLEFPVVIIADIASSFKGRADGEMPFDEDYGFAPKCYYPDSKLRRPTVLHRLRNMRAKRENIKNELNLFYVACTRAMCNLHVMCSAPRGYDKSDRINASCYAELFDVNAYCAQYMPEPEEIRGGSEQPPLISSPDGRAYKEISARFMRPYAHAGSVDLPVKSSASQLLRGVGDEYFAEHVLFKADADDTLTGAERGTAYHRFLELCDFAVRDRQGVLSELDKFVNDGLMPPEQAALLSADNLVEILAMPVFSRLEGAELYRERKFLCELPASELFDTSANDGILVQGAIDLLATGPFGTAIIDYKYSKKDDDSLTAAYAAQLALYKKAVASVLKISEDSISTTIVNIYARREINL